MSSIDRFCDETRAFSPQSFLLPYGHPPIYSGDPSFFNHEVHESLEVFLYEDVSFAILFSKSIASVGRGASLVPAFSYHPEKTADLMDVIFAILSESPSALSNLIDTYNKMGIKVDINEPAIETGNIWITY